MSEVLISVINRRVTPALPLSGKQVSDHRVKRLQHAPPVLAGKLVALLRLPGVPPPRPAVSLINQSPLPIKRRGLPRYRPSVRLPGLPLASPSAEGGLAFGLGQERRGGSTGAPAVVDMQIAIYRILPCGHKAGIRVGHFRSQFFGDLRPGRGRGSSCHEFSRILTKGEIINANNGRMSEWSK
jgi:hypothetical protein